MRVAFDITVEVMDNWTWIIFIAFDITIELIVFSK